MQNTEVMDILPVETEQLEEKLTLNDGDFARAYSKGLNATVRFLRSIGANMDMAEEVAQAAWARGWQYRAQLMNPQLACAWVNTIARNLYRSMIVHEQRFEKLEDAPLSPTLVRMLEASDMMDVCSEAELKILSLFYIEGYTAMEIAEKEGMCATTVRVRLMRIRRSLRNRVSQPVSEQAEPKEGSVASFRAKKKLLNFPQAQQHMSSGIVQQL